LEAAAWEIALKILSIVSSVATVILGVTAIWLSLYFYKRSNELYAHMTQMLSRIEASSEATKVTSTELTRPLVDGVVASLQERTLTQVEDPTVLRISARVDKALEKVPGHARKQAAEEIVEELKELFTTLRAEAAPTAPEYDWGPFIRRINQLEREHNFLSVKWLNEKKLADDLTMRESLQVAIKYGILEMYWVENPKNPPFRTRACKLARQHPVVKKVLGEQSGTVGGA